MKLNGRFIAGVVIFLLLVFLARWQMPRRFVWTPSFSHDDKQPFGCYVIDSLMSVSLPQSYSVTNQTLYEISAKESDSLRGILIVSESFRPSKTDISSMKRLLDKGNHVMVLTSSTSSDFDDSLGFGTYGGYGFRLSQAKQTVASGFRRDSLHWTGRSQKYPDHVYRFLPQVVSGELFVYTNKNQYHTLYSKWSEKWDNDTVSHWEESPSAVSVPKGKGRLTIGCDPLLFTNYTALDGENVHLVFRLMSEMDSLPIVRTEAYMQKDAGQQESPLRFFLQEPPLRWAVWLTVGGLLLFFVFTARRRQRAIPVVSPPINRSKEFVELIGTLYYQWHDNRDIVKKKYTFLTECLRRKLMIDIDDETLYDQTADILSVHTGLRKDEVSRQLRELRQAAASEGSLSDKEMQRLIDLMDFYQRL